MEPKLFEHLEVIHMFALRQRYMELLSLQGIQNPLYHSEKLKVRMRKPYLGRISLWHPRYQSEVSIVYRDEVSRIRLLNCGLTHGSESELFITNPEDVPFKNDEYHLAKAVRAAPLSQGPNMPWLPYSNNIEEENVMVPTVVYNSLTCFLSEGGEGEEKKEKVNAKGHCQRLVLSLAQDLLNYVRNGMQKTSKHVSLPLALKNLTSSKEVITLLNRYGHGISYYQVLDMEMRLVENLLEGKEHDVILQKVVSPYNAFSIFRWDNTDLLEETLSGGGTTHCTKASFKLCFTTKVVSSVKIGREVMLEADRDLFARLLIVAQTREMDLREVFKYFLWLAKCSINLYLCSTKNIFYSTVYSYFQHFIFMFNNAHSLFIFN